MIDGLLLLLELGLLMVLLRTVWLARQKRHEDDLGLFAYKPELEPPPSPRRPGGLRPGPRPGSTQHPDPGAAHNASHSATPGPKGHPHA